jgi:hypothetical protein
MKWNRLIAGVCAALMMGSVLPAGTVTDSQSALTASAADVSCTFAKSEKSSSIAIEQLEVSLDTLKADNYVVPVFVKITTPGVTSIDFGIKSDLKFSVYSDEWDDNKLESLFTKKSASDCDFLNKGFRTMTTASDSDHTWCVWADIKARPSFYTALEVHVPNDAKPGDVYPIKYLSECDYKPHVFTDLTNYDNRKDYIADGDFEGLDGYIKISGGSGQTLTEPPTQATTEPVTKPTEYGVKHSFTFSGKEYSVYIIPESLEIPLDVV